MPEKMKSKVVKNESWAGCYDCKGDDEGEDVSEIQWRGESARVRVMIHATEEGHRVWVQFNQQIEYDGSAGGG